MTVEQALDTYLKADPALAALVGTRIYWIQADQTAILPYVVFQKIVDLDDPIAFDALNTGNCRVQISCVGENRATANVMYRIREMMRGSIVISDPLYPSESLYPSATLYPNGADIGYSTPGGMREVFNADSNRYVFYLDYDIAYEC